MIMHLDDQPAISIANKHIETFLPLQRDVVMTKNFSLSVFKIDLVKFSARPLRLIYSSTVNFKPEMIDIYSQTEGCVFKGKLLLF